MVTLLLRRKMFYFFLSWPLIAELKASLWINVCSGLEKVHMIGIHRNNWPTEKLQKEHFRISFKLTRLWDSGSCQSIVQTRKLLPHYFSHTQKPRPSISAKTLVDSVSTSFSLFPSLPIYHRLRTTLPLWSWFPIKAIVVAWKSATKFHIWKILISSSSSPLQYMWYLCVLTLVLQCVIFYFLFLFFY